MALERAEATTPQPGTRRADMAAALDTPVLADLRRRVLVPAATARLQTRQIHTVMRPIAQRSERLHRPRRVRMAVLRQVAADMQQPVTALVAILARAAQ